MRTPRRLPSLFVTCAFIALILVLTITPTAVQAGTFTVNSSANDGTGSLRAAITAANGSAENDTINITVDDIFLTSSLPSITNNGTLTINGNGVSITRDVGASAFRILRVNTGANVTLNLVTIIGGDAGTDLGGGIYNFGTLTVNDGLITENTAAWGGGIYNAGGTVTINDGVITLNTSTTGGGGVLNNVGTLTVTDTTFGDNSSPFGGGLYNFSGTAGLTNSTFSGNSATSGGGIINNGGGLTMTGGGFDLNTAESGGGIFTSLATASLTNVQFTNNSASNNGGGISVDGGTVTLTSITLSTNTITGAGNGGGLSVGGGASVTMSGSSVTGNIATVNGGGIIVGGTNSLTLSTTNITGNDAPYGGGIFNGGTLNLTGGSVSGNSALFDGAGINNFGGTLTIDGSTIQNNTLDGFGNGGGIFNSGSLTVNNASIGTNAASDGTGGGFANDGGTADFTGGSFTSNSAESGGGIGILSGTVTTFETLFEGNTASSGAGGGGIDNVGTLDVTLSEFIGNSAGSGGGIRNQSGATATVTRATFGENVATALHGGAIYNNGTITIVGTTLDTNQSTLQGGGLYNQSTATVINSTLTGNNGSSGGGIASTGGTTTVTNSTISGNSAGAFGGGGVYNTSGATLNLRNSIIANSTGGGECQTSFAPTNAQFSIIEGGLSCVTGTNTSNKTTDPNLGTMTGNPSYFPLNVGSPAIDAGSNALIPSGIFIDQPGNFRIINTTVDMGSVESSSTLPPQVSITPASASIAEGSSTNFTIARTGSTAGGLIVSLQVLPVSAATTTGDYTLSGGSISGQTGSVTVMLLAGVSSINLNVAVTNDIVAEPDNALTIEVLNTSTYTASLTDNKSTVTIPANDLVVTTMADSGEGSLRQAIANANAFASADTITFNTSGTINLTGGQYTLENNGTLTINGGGTVTIAGDGVSETRLFEVVPGANVTLNGLTMTNGLVTGDGGAIYNAGTLTVTNSTVSNSTAISGQGGGIFNGGTLTLINSTISGNSVDSATFGGGGIFNDFARVLTITNSTFSNNSTTDSGGGGAIYSTGSTGAAVTITNSTFNGNSATGDFSSGGAINNAAGSVLTITRTTFNGNFVSGANNTGGAISTGAAMTVTASTFTDNAADGNGGALYLVGGGAGNERTVINSTFSGNEALAGGAISNANSGTLNLVNSTVSDNSATTAGGLHTGVSAISNVDNSIIANSLSGGQCFTDSSTVNARNSLIEGGLTCVNGTNTANLTADPNLGALTGSPAYFLLNSGSPAINTGSNALIPAGITTDQAGSSRIVNTTVDMGSFEFGGTPTASLTVNMMLQGRPAPPHASYVITAQVQVRPSGSLTPILTQDFVTNTSGQFTIPTLTPAAYDIRIKTNGALARSYPITLIPGANTLNVPSDQPLRAGDANGDNVVNLIDFSLLAASFGTSTGNPNYNPNADFNNDGAINLIDFSLLASNFNTAGAP